ncbi:MAG TPA: hypothetical protein VF113_02350 [Stellaceae bacterium]
MQMPFAQNANSFVPMQTAEDFSSAVMHRLSARRRIGRRAAAPQCRSILADSAARIPTDLDARRAAPKDILIDHIVGEGIWIREWSVWRRHCLRDAEELFR